MTLGLAANVALCVVTVFTFIFMVTYVVGSPWWATQLGRIYAFKTTLITLVLLQNSASVLSSSDYPFRQHVRLVIYAGGAVAMLALWVQLRRHQREGKSARRAAGDERSWRQVWGDTLKLWARHRR